MRTIVPIEKNTSMTTTMKPSGCTFVSFIVYTSDIPEVAGTSMATFNDDTAVFTVASTENEAKHRLQNALTSVLEWTRKWCIKLNSSK